MNRNQYRKLVRDALVAADSIVAMPARELASPDLARAFANRSCAYHVLDRAPVFDKTTLMHAIYQSCGLPATFGFNWDALADSLSDFDMQPVQARVLALHNPSVLKQRAPADYDTFIDVVRAADDRAREHGRRVLLLPGS